MIREKHPAISITIYSKPSHISNKIPYKALPSGCAHMETVSITEITFPMKFGGVSVCINDIICTVKMVENTIMIKQHIVIIR